MKLLNFYEKTDEKNIICLGRFDGLHLGHKTLIYKGVELRNQLNNDTKLAVFMFHGSEPISPFKRIFTFRESVKKFKEEPVDTIIVAPETEKFFLLSKDTFLEYLKTNFNPVAIICGEDYTFGFNREGNKDYLKKYCKKNGIDFYCLPLVYKGGEKISSSRIKELLKEGKVDVANDLLGDNYFIEGPVVRGRGVGKKIGFPTLNMEIPNEKAPLKIGVYATLAKYDGEIHEAITNYGSAPTFGDDKVLMETHVIGTKCDLYGLDVRIDFKKFIREDKKFNNVKELIEQLTKDMSYND